MRHPRLFIVAAAVFALDQAAKLLWHDADFDLIPGVLAFHGVRNTGMAFGMLGNAPWLLALITAAVCVALLLYLRRHTLNRLCQYAAGLMLGGALGNLLDRLRLGFVVDFIDPVFLHWFVCNPADIAITCGAVLLAGWLAVGGKRG